MSARTVRIALALLVGLVIGGSCAMATTVADRTSPAVLIPTATLERAAEPVCSLLADGADSPAADGQWAALVATYGTLDYVGGTEYGTVYAVDGGHAIGYATAEDSDIWSDPSCLSYIDSATTTAPPAPIIDPAGCYDEPSEVEGGHETIGYPTDHPRTVEGVPVPCPYDWTTGPAPIIGGAR